MATREELQLIVSAIDAASSELRRISGELEGIGEEASGAQTTNQMFFTELMSGINVALKGLEALGAAAQKAFELAELGAQAKQTMESFEGLSQELGLSTDYINKLQEASNNTLGSLDLMGGLTTLMAGTTHEMGQAFADAYPQLVEYAKAASKLNPALGDTTYMLDSISRGIKRNSPMILDNLGIVVKIGKANEEYAASLGKSVEALTTEEQSMALLNATLEAGGRLVEQVGGNVDAATDSFEQYKVATEEAKNELALYWHEIVEGTGFIEEATKSAAAATDTLRLGRLLEEAEELNLLTKEQELLARRLINQRVDDEQRVRNLALANDLLNSAFDRQNEALEEAQEQHRLLAEQYDDGREKVILLTDATGMLAADIWGAEAALKGYGNALDGAKTAEEYAAEKAAESKRQQDVLNDARTRAAEAATAYRDRLRELAAAEGDAFTAALEGQEPMESVARMLYDAADAAGAGADQLAILAGMTGEYTQTQIDAALRTAALKGAVEDVWKSIDAGKDTLETGAERLADFKADIDAATGKKILEIELPSSAQSAMDKVERLRKNMVEDIADARPELQIDKGEAEEAVEETDTLLERMKELDETTYTPKVDAAQIRNAYQDALSLQRLLLNIQTLSNSINIPGGGGFVDEHRSRGDR